MQEKHMLVDGQQVSAALFDFGLYFFNNAHETVRQGFGPYFYLPKMESHLEARYLFAYQVYGMMFSICLRTFAVCQGEPFEPLF